MKYLKKGSTWLSLLEQLTYLCPILATVLYYYYTTLEEVVSQSSKATFSIAVSAFVLFIIYKKAMTRHIDDLRRSVVQTKTDLENGVGDKELVSKNLCKKRIELDMYTRAEIFLGLLVCSVTIYIFESAMVSITRLIMIGMASVAAGSGIHVGVLNLKRMENRK